MSELREYLGGGGAAALSEVEQPGDRVSKYQRNRHRAYHAAARYGDKSSLIKPGVGHGIQLLGSLVATAGLLMPYGTTDDLNQGLASVTSGAQEPLSDTVEAPSAAAEDVDFTDLRGVIAVDYQYPILFTKRIEITPGCLAKWEPKIDFDERDFRDEDD